MHVNQNYVQHNNTCGMNLTLFYRAAISHTLTHHTHSHHYPENSISYTQLIQSHTKFSHKITIDNLLTNILHTHKLDTLLLWTYLDDTHDKGDGKLDCETGKETNLRHAYPHTQLPQISHTYTSPISLLTHTLTLPTHLYHDTHDIVSDLYRHQ